MDHENIQSLIKNTIDGLHSFLENPLNEEGSKVLISDLSNLQAFMVAMHIIKINNSPLELAKRGIELFHKTHEAVLEHYINELYKVEKPEQINYIFSISTLKICTASLSSDMQGHKLNKLRSISEKILREIIADVQGIIFSREELEYFCSSLAGSFLSSMLYSAIKSDTKITGDDVKNLLHALLYKTFQILNAFADEKLFNNNISFEEKKIGDV